MTKITDSDLEQLANESRQNAAPPPVVIIHHITQGDAFRTGLFWALGVCVALFLFSMLTYFVLMMLAAFSGYRFGWIKEALL